MISFHKFSSGGEDKENERDVINEGGGGVSVEKDERVERGKGEEGSRRKRKEKEVEDGGMGFSLYLSLYDLIYLT